MVKHAAQILLLLSLAPPLLGDELPSGSGPFEPQPKFPPLPDIEGPVCKGDRLFRIEQPAKFCETLREQCVPAGRYWRMNGIEGGMATGSKNCYLIEISGEMCPGATHFQGVVCDTPEVPLKGARIYEVDPQTLRIRACTPESGGCGAKTPPGGPRIPVPIRGPGLPPGAVGGAIVEVLCNPTPLGDAEIPFCDRVRSWSRDDIERELKRLRKRHIELCKGIDDWQGYSGGIPFIGRCIVNTITGAGVMVEEEKEKERAVNRAIKCLEAQLYRSQSVMR